MEKIESFFIPDGSIKAIALSRTTHLGIVAHQDDLEFMALHGIIECYHSHKKWFSGIVCTDGAGSVRRGPYADIPTSELCRIRMQEQCTAAAVGHYSFVDQLGYPSKEISRPLESDLIPKLTALLGKMNPTALYTHNPADKHETHLCVLIAVLQAIREVPTSHRPKRLWGCEMWRGLDWLADSDKVILDVGGHDHLAAALSGVFDSQIDGGKRYDLAVEGRRRANATLLDAHSSDTLTSASFAMDLSRLIGADTVDLVDFTLQYVNRLGEDIRLKLQRSLTR